MKKTIILHYVKQLWKRLKFGNKAFRVQSGVSKEGGEEKIKKEKENERSEYIRQICDPKLIVTGLPIDLNFFDFIK